MIPEVISSVADGHINKILDRTHGAVALLRRPYSFLLAMSP